MKYILIACLSAFVTGFCVEAAVSNLKNDGNTKQKDEIMLRDQIDTTDSLAIPLDDSEIEDEEEVNRAEKKQVFNIPSYKKSN